MEQHVAVRLFSQQNQHTGKRTREVRERRGEGRVEPRRRGLRDVVGRRPRRCRDDGAGGTSVDESHLSVVPRQRHDVERRDDHLRGERVWRGVSLGDGEREQSALAPLAQDLYLVTWRRTLARKDRGDRRRRKIDGRLGGRGAGVRGPQRAPLRRAPDDEPRGLENEAALAASDRVEHGRHITL